jgi:predicted HD superfamily hydrolase involved in NAD metabolism
MSDGISIDLPFDDRRPTSAARSRDRCRRAGIAPYVVLVKRMLSPARFAHLDRVTEVAEAIGRANGFDRGELRATVLASILHDVARELDPERLVALAPPEHPMERAHPLSLHGRAGRALAASWGVTDERVLGAIEGHVFGVPYGDRVGMAVYIADVSEPGRGVNHEIRDLAMRDLDAAYRRAVDAKVRYLRRCGKDVHPRTLKVHDEIARAS